MELKNRPRSDGKISKVANIKYEKVEMQQYLYENTNTNISKFISKARQKHWKLKHTNLGSMKIKNVHGAK